MGLDVIPTSKFDLEAIEELQNAEDSEVLENAEELLNWLQDINWPVFEGICIRLSNLGHELHDSIRNILLETDSILKSNIVGYLLPKFSLEAQSKYTQELKKILINPSNSDFEEGLIDFVEILLSQNDKSI